MRGTITYTEECSNNPSHHTLDISVQNQPLEEALASKREECPVCGADVISEETHE